ncbi:MAG TPA: hypothetical protein VGI60_00045 [Chthoniobacterales bacterium]|jgi:hypothetical protein
MSAGLFWFLSYATTSLAWFALIVWLCLLLYRSLRLPALPWIAFRYFLAFFAWLANSYIFHRIFPSGTFIPSDRFAPDGWILFWEMGIDAISDLLVAVLAFSEVAFLISRAFPEVQSRLLVFLLAARRRVGAIGLAACLLTFCVPIGSLLFLWLHGPVSHKV